MVTEWYNTLIPALWQILLSGSKFLYCYVLMRFLKQIDRKRKLGVKLPRYHWSHSDTTHSSPLRDIILLSGSLYKIASLEAINWSLIGILASCKGKWFFETVVITKILKILNFQNSHHFIQDELFKSKNWRKPIFAAIWFSFVFVHTT